MGIDNHFLRFLIQSSKNGVDFTHTATIGRQNWYRMSPQLLQATFKKEGVSLSTEQAQTLFAEDGIYTQKPSSVFLAQLPLSRSTIRTTRMQLTLLT